MLKRMDGDRGYEAPAEVTWIDMKLGSIHDAEMIAYRASLKTAAGRRAAWLEALVADLMAEDAPEATIARLRTEARRAFARARRSLRCRKSVLPSRARRPMRPRGRSHRPARSVSRTQRACTRSHGSDDPDPGPPSEPPPVRPPAGSTSRSLHAETRLSGAGPAHVGWQ
jgi:hypothetical protein